MQLTIASSPSFRVLSPEYQGTEAEAERSKQLREIGSTFARDPDIACSLEL